MLFSFVMIIDSIRFDVCAKCFQQYRDRKRLDWNLVDIVKKKVNLYIYEVNTMRSKQNGRYFKDDNFKCSLWNEMQNILTHISLKFVPVGESNQNSA